MNILKKLTIITFLYIWSVTAHAVPITTAVGNVNILGTDYLLSILYDSAGNSTDQSFNALMPSITFTTEADATAAVIAIDAAFPILDWNPAASSNGTRVAFGLSVDTYDYMTVSSNSSPFGPFNRNRDEANVFSFAQFSAVVPEPSIIALFGLGLFGIGFARRRKHN